MAIGDKYKIDADMRTALAISSELDALDRTLNWQLSGDLG